jgi:hypothetical protein
MSKKSRKRNRKILKALAVGLGAAALMRGRNKGAVSTVGQPVGVDRMSPSQPPIHGTDHIPAAPKTIVADTGNTGSNTDSGFQTRFTKKVDGKWMGPGQIIAHRKLTAGNKVPPSMRGGAETAQGFVRRVPTGVRTRMGNTNYGWSTTPYKKGGRVGVGKAKRGFGRALKKGK